MDNTADENEDEDTECNNMYDEQLIKEVDAIYTNNKDFDSFYPKDL